MGDSGSPAAGPNPRTEAENEKRYVQVGLTIAALVLGLAVVSIFVGLDGVRVEQTPC